MFIANGKKKIRLKYDNKWKIYTFPSKISSLDAKKKWIIGSLSSNGTIKIDDGASKVF